MCCSPLISSLTARSGEGRGRVAHEARGGKSGTWAGGAAGRSHAPATGDPARTLPDHGDLQLLPPPPLPPSPVPHALSQLQSVGALSSRQAPFSNAVLTLSSRQALL
jgi:hypothetical protein